MKLCLYLHLTRCPQSEKFFYHVKVHINTFFSMGISSHHAQPLSIAVGQHTTRARSFVGELQHLQREIPFKITQQNFQFSTIFFFKSYSFIYYFMGIHVLYLTNIVPKKKYPGGITKIQPLARFRTPCLTKA